MWYPVLHGVFLHFLRGKHLQCTEFSPCNFPCGGSEPAFTFVAWSDNVKYKIRTYRATVCATLPIVTIWQQVPDQKERK